MIQKRTNVTGRNGKEMEVMLKIMPGFVQFVNMTKSMAAHQENVGVYVY